MGKWKDFFLGRVITFRIDEDTYRIMLRISEEDTISEYIRNLIAKNIEQKMKEEQENKDKIKH